MKLARLKISYRNQTHTRLSGNDGAKGCVTLTDFITLAGKDKICGFLFSFFKTKGLESDLFFIN